MSHELWCQGIDGICCKVHSTLRIEIPDGTIGKLITEYFSENGRRIRIIGEIFINGRVQFIGLLKKWEWISVY